MDLVFFDSLFCWGIRWQWPADDSRRAGVRDGTIDPATAFDVIGFAPPDVGVDDAFHLLTKGLRDSTNASVKAMLANVHAYNEAVTSRAADEVIESGAERLGHALAVDDGAGVSVSASTKKKGKK